MTIEPDPQEGRDSERIERRRKGSLRRRILVVGLGGTVLTVVGLVILAGMVVTNRAALIQVSEGLVEEHRIGDRITQAVVRLLAYTAASYDTGDPGPSDEFRAAGREAYEEIQLYLDRPLSGEERVQLETIREQLQRLEVTALSAGELRRVGRSDAAVEVLDAVRSEAFSLLASLEALLQMRRQGFDALRARENRTFRIIYLGGGTLALLLLIGSAKLTSYVHRSVLRPLDSLASATERLGLGDLDVRVQAAHADEFAALTAGFNRMASSLQQTQARLEQRNQQLLEALDQVRAAQAELIQSEKLSAIGRMTAGLAHELNNPLASVLGYGDLLRTWLEKGGDVPSEKVSEEFLAPILQEATRAQHLVRNFLRFARRSEAEIGPVDLREAVEVVAGLRRYAFHQNGLEFVVDEFPKHHVLAERQQLQGILLNLANNAYDAMSGKGSGTLRVHAADRSGRIELVFDDDGPGIEAPDHVFEPFYTTKPVGEGVGLGLAVAYRRMNEFGGSVRAENRPEGGARFVLTFAPAEGSVRAPVADPEPTESVRVSRPDGKRPTILVVEDEAPLRKLQKRLLAQIDADVLLASGVEEARGILRTTEVDAIVSDVRMPGETGLDLYDWVEREMPSLSRHFLFVTGDVGAPEVLALADRRPEIFVHKPFEVEEYLTRVAAVLE